MNFWNRVKNVFWPKDIVVKNDFHGDQRIGPIPKTNDEIATIKFRMLVVEAERWLYVRETGGENKGREVEMFQKAVDGKAQGEPWCAAYVAFCIAQVDRIYEVLYGKDELKSQLYSSEHCLSVWNKTPITSRIETKLHPGLVSIWQHYRHGKASSSGHMGIVKKIIDNDFFQTIEGNTRDRNAVEREGDGVYNLRRRFESSENFRLRGFLKPWDGQYLESFY